MGRGHANYRATAHGLTQSPFESMGDGLNGYYDPVYLPKISRLP